VARPQQQAGVETATRILDVAEELVQQRGFNGFSYADVAAELGITTATLHYHFAGKAELGRSLIRRYATRFYDALDGIDGRASRAPDKLQAYVDLYAGVLRDERLCLCGMLAAEYNTLPEQMRNAVLEFFEENEQWLTRVLEDGRKAGEVEFSGASEEAARMIVYSLEGAMLVARPYGDLERFQSAADRLLAGFKANVPV
jgi:TetR/AcrR family transcriptional repressor of nem operon